MRRIQGIKRQKFDEEDRLSALPDCLIQHILSFLPSTKQAIQTGILSKRWRNHWTRVPVLVFHSTGKSDQNFSQFIDRTLVLHNCSNIKKFQIKFDAQGSDPQIVPKLQFAANKHVEELILHLSPINEEGKVDKNLGLPKFLFTNDSLVKLELFNCYFIQNQRADWPNLKELRLDCSNMHRLIVENILPGCPLLELLEITNSLWYSGAVIASKSLKKLSFIDTHETRFRDGHAEISCPNLEELCLKISPNWTSRVHLSNKMMDNVLSKSPFIRTLELSGFYCSDRLMIASKSLKTLVFGRHSMFSDLEVSCPCLDEFKLSPSMLPRGGNVDKKSLALKILRQLQHVKLLHIAGWLIETLEVEDSSSLSLTCKCLTLDGNDFDRHLLRIVSVISCSPLLEKLVIKFPPNQIENILASQGSNDCRTENSSNAYGVVFINCSVSNLKTVEIIGLSERDDSCKLIFNFVEFLLENGRVLEKMVFKLGECGKKFFFDVSKKLLSLPRCSPNMIIDLL